MPKFEIAYTEEVWKKVVVEAVDEDVAMQKFWNGEFDEPEITGFEIQEGIDIEELDIDEDLV